MIEKFTKEELDQILSELKIEGYMVDSDSKSYLFQRARMDANIPFVYSDIRKSIYDIADVLTDNYSEKSRTSGGARKIKNHNVPKDKKIEYCSIMKDILGAIKPYIGRA